MSFLAGVTWIFASALVAAAAVRGLFALSYLTGGFRSPRRGEPARHRRFLVVVPAHNEELLIRDLITSVRATDYPQDRIEILVVADNCDDATADLVRESGETVLERHDLENRGKGQALSWVFQQRDLEGLDAIAIIDADNLVDPAFFAIMNHELEAGWERIQGYDGIANPDESIMTRMLSVTYVMKNLLYNGGKARLGWSIPLMGTGMCFSREAIQRTGWDAMTIGEDYEQSLNLVEAGERIRFAKEARIGAQESSTLRQGYVQRQRWMSGRRVLFRRALRSLVEGLRTGRGAQVAVAVDLLMPTYASMLNGSLIAFGLALPLFWGRDPALLWTLFGVLVYQGLEVLAALFLMRASPRFVASLAFAPIFLVWRGVIDVLATFGHRNDRWSRTDRVTHAALDAEATERPPS